MRRRSPDSSPPVARRLPVLLRRAWYGLNQAFRRRIAHTGCTPDQYIVLRNLAETGGDGLTQAELTRSMSSDPNTVAALVSRMVRLNLVERKPHATDRRSHQLQLKPLGKKRFCELMDIAIQLQDEVMTGLPRPVQEAFLAHLEGVADRCRLAAEQ